MNRALSAFVLVATVLMSVTATAEPAAWSAQRADTIAQGRWEVGVFSPLRYGLTDDLELSAHPLAFFAMPHVSAKVAWNQNHPWRLSTNHGLQYPTLLLGMLSREGTGGVLPSTTDVPHIIGITNELLATTTVPMFRRWFTAKVGFTIAPRFGGEALPLIELPIVYPRTAAYTAMITGHAALALEGEITGPFYYFYQAKGFFIPGLEGSFAIEQQVQLSWRPGERFMLTAGGMGIYGGYPYGARVHFLPLIDAKFAF